MSCHTPPLFTTLYLPLTFFVCYIADNLAVPRSKPRPCVASYSPPCQHIWSSNLAADKWVRAWCGRRNVPRGLWWGLKRSPSSKRLQTIFVPARAPQNPTSGSYDVLQAFTGVLNRSCFLRIVSTGTRWWQRKTCWLEMLVCCCMLCVSVPYPALRGMQIYKKGWPEPFVRTAHLMVNNLVSLGLLAKKNVLALLT